jgi:hypothetical protein
MFWLIFEGVLALLVFVLIVWWTLPRKREADGTRQPQSPQGGQEAGKDD